MNGPLDRIARPLRLAGLVLGPGSLCAGAPALAETRAGATASVGAAVESRPYLESGNAADIAASLDVMPWLRFGNASTSLDFNGSFRLDKYRRDENGTNLMATANVGVQHRLSNYARVNGNLSYATTRNGGIVIFQPVNGTGTGTGTVTPPPTTLLPDFSLAGTRARIETITGNAGANIQLSPKDQVSVSGFATRSTNNYTSDGDFNYLGGGATYMRTLSQYASVSAGVQVAKSEYPQKIIGNSTFISPDIGVQLMIGKNTSVSASVGASFSRITLFNGQTSKSSSLSGRLQACRTLKDGSLCLNAAQSLQPTASGTISKVSTASVAYSMRVSRRDTLGFNGAFSYVSNDRNLPSIAAELKYYNTGADFSHNFSQRLVGNLSASYFRVEDSFRTTSGFSFGARLQYRFGAIS